MPSRGIADSIIDFLETQNGQRITLSAFSVIAVLVLLAFPGGALAYAFGIPLIFFVPGFAVVRMFFWKGTSPEAKFVLSLGLSVLVVIFLGLLLVLTPIGLAADTTRASLVLFTIAAVALETYWEPAEQTAEKEPAQAPPKPPVRIKVDKVVAAMIGAALVVSAISLGLIITADYPSRTYFALTDDNGSADINTSRTINSTLVLIVHMKNGEDGEREFRMVAHNETLFGSQWFNQTMAKGEVKNVSVSIDLIYYGVFRLDFDLYIQDQGKPEYFYGNLHLWIDIT